MAYCENCGSEIADGAKFCTNCGAPQQHTHMEYGQTAPMQQENVFSQPVQENYNSGENYSNGNNYNTGNNFNTGNNYSAGYDYGTSAGYGTNFGSYGGSSVSGPVPGPAFMEAVKTCFSKYAAFSGRARRSEYWYFILFNLLVNLALGFLGNMIFGAPRDSTTNVLQNIYSLAVFIPGLAVFWRRMHDIGKSGGWFFLNFVPLIGQIILLVFLIRDSDAGENQFGMSPKYPA